MKKSEIRISGEASAKDQFETNPNSQNANFLNFCLFRSFEIWSFEVVSDFGLIPDGMLRPCFEFAIRSSRNNLISILSSISLQVS